MPDIDIDFPDRDAVLSKIPHVVAGRFERDEYKKHNSGVYVHTIPVDPLTNIATIPYEEAEARGYFKIDFLNVSAYKDVRSEEHMVQLMNTEPLWDLMYEKDVCDQLFHINGYHNLLAQLKPTNIIALATVLALIRPGKKHLVQKCIDQGFDSIQDEVWTKTDEGYSFKKSHAVGYAHVIVMQLNLICEKVSYEFS
jgi:DNA polymerase III alpha subunit